MPALRKLKQSCSSAWSVLRELSGDDAYERYVAHHATAHPGQVPLDRATFFKTEQQRKWEGVRRCC
jgi:uncharacterized short protein YbdD (DUF466 family)